MARPKPILRSLSIEPSDLEDKLIDVIDNHIIENKEMSMGELIGTIEMVKLSYLENDA